MHHTIGFKGTNPNKGALAVPCKGDRKTEDFSQREGRNRVRGEEKRLERKQRENEN